MDNYEKGETKSTDAAQKRGKQGWWKQASISRMPENNLRRAVASSPPSNHVGVHHDAHLLFPNNSTPDSCSTCHNDCVDCFALPSTNMKQLPSSPHLGETDDANRKVLHLDLNIRSFHSNMNQSFREIVVDFDVVKKPGEGTCNNSQPSHVQMTQLQQLTATRHNTCDTNGSSSEGHSRSSGPSSPHEDHHKVPQDLRRYHPQGAGFHKPRDSCSNEPQDVGFSRGASHTMAPSNRFCTNIAFERNSGTVSTSEAAGSPFASNDGCGVALSTQNVANVGVPVQRNGVSLHGHDNSKCFKGQHEDVDENVCTWKRANMKSSHEMGGDGNRIRSVPSTPHDVFAPSASAQPVEEGQLCHDLEHAVPHHSPLLLNPNAFSDSRSLQFQRLQHALLPLQEHNSAHVLGSRETFGAPPYAHEHHGTRNLGYSDAAQRVSRTETSKGRGIRVGKSPSTAFDGLRDNSRENQKSQKSGMSNGIQNSSPANTFADKTSSVHDASRTKSHASGKPFFARTRRSITNVRTVDEALERKLVNTTSSTMAMHGNRTPIPGQNYTKTSMESSSLEERERALHACHLDVEADERANVDGGEEEEEEEEGEEGNEENRVQPEPNNNFAYELESELQNGLREGSHFQMQSMEKNLFELFTKAQNETQRLIVRAKAERKRGDISHVSPEKVKALKKRVEDCERVCKARHSKRFGAFSVTVDGHPRQPIARSACKFCNSKHEEDLETEKRNNPSSTDACVEEISRLIEKNRLESSKLAQRICHTLNIGSV